MASGAAKMMLQCGLELGSLSMYDIEVERRPYHRNCGCALHNLKGVCSSACSRTRNISFSKKQAWSDCFFSIAAPKFSSQSSLLTLGDEYFSEADQKISTNAPLSGMKLCRGNERRNSSS
ncbi:hypothetical protein REPUB_Repub03eG0110400 [Reevesia pubescens]